MRAPLFSDYFDACYDMLSMLIHGTLIPQQGSTQRSSDSRESTRNRFPAYDAIVKKIKVGEIDAQMAFSGKGALATFRQSTINARRALEIFCV